MKQSKLKIVLGAIAALIAVLVAVVAVSLLMLNARTDALHDDWLISTDEAVLNTPVQVEGVEAITQDVSCGYAVIEMFSAWDGGTITEESLQNEYGKVVTSTGQSFCDEMNKQFPGYKTVMRKNLTDSELLEAVHGSLKADVPVPIEWAAQFEGEWTLHYSLVTGMDIPNNKVTVANPYGYVEELTVDEFLNRMSFEAYEGMPLFLKLGFAFGIFEQNTVFIPERISR